MSPQVCLMLTVEWCHCDHITVYCQRRSSWLIPVSEQIERDALAELHAAASASLRDALGIRAFKNGDGLVSMASVLPDSAIVINRAIGLGLSAAMAENTVNDVVRSYRDAGIGRYFFQLHPEAAPGQIRDWLQREGLTRARGWQKFVREAAHAPAVSCDLRLEKIGEDRGTDFGRIVCNAFDLGDAAIPWLARLPSRPEWHVFMSFDGDMPAGAGALFIRDGIAWSDFGATDPVFRRRGSQGALLARRIEFAMQAGCREIHTCTGEDVAGDPQHSYRNILKMGFRPTYVRDNYAPGR